MGSEDDALGRGGRDWQRRLKIAAMLDTGFDGDICLPIDVAVTLGLELVWQELVELADGSKKDELVFEGRQGFSVKRAVLKLSSQRARMP